MLTVNGHASCDVDQILGAYGGKRLAERTDVGNEGIICGWRRWRMKECGGGERAAGRWRNKSVMGICLCCYILNRFMIIFSRNLSANDNLRSSPLSKAVSFYLAIKPNPPDRYPITRR